MSGDSEGREGERSRTASQGRPQVPGTGEGGASGASHASNEQSAGVGPTELQRADVGGAGSTGAVAGRARSGMFGIQGSGDTSGFGGLQLPAHAPAPAERPYGGWFDEVTDELVAALSDVGVEPSEAILQVTVAHGELTYYVAPEHLVEVAGFLRDDPALRFEFCSGISGVDYGEEVPDQIHVVTQLLSMTYRRRLRLEVALPAHEPHCPSLVDVYPTADWHERETWDMFGVVFDGHPSLTRILMPDDWNGHPQLKSYPLGGIPVEYHDAEIPPPDQRRAYT